MRFSQLKLLPTYFCAVLGHTGQATEPPLFQALAPDSHNLHFHHPFDEDHPQAYLYHSGFAVGGISLGDVNGDGLLDIHIVSGPSENNLFIAIDDLTYSPSPSFKDPAPSVWGTGASLVDIDNDGDLDLYQCNYDHPNQFFLNNGNGQFTELKGAAGLNVQDASMTANFADIDNDGDLDMFLLCNRYYRPEGRPAKPPYSIKSGSLVVTPEYEKYYRLKLKASGDYGIDDYGRADYLFLNQGNDSKGQPQFKDISAESGIQQTGYGLSSVWWDFDEDGDLDLYVANDFTSEDRLFRNNGTNSLGIPTFTDVIADHFPSISWSSMGSDVADINHDGRPDLISVDMSATSHFKAKLNMGEMNDSRRLVMEQGWPRQSMRNHLFMHSGSHQFKESAFASGVASSDWSWTSKFGDLDNDGHQDLFISNGMSRNFTNADHAQARGDANLSRIGNTLWDLHKAGEPMLEKNLVFQNTNGRKFKKRDDWGLGLLGMSYSAAMGDLDNDGDLDLVVSDLGKNVQIFENQGAGGNSLRVKLSGKKSNRMGIGAKVVVTDSDGTQRTRWMNPWTGFQSQNDSTLHFGLGSSTPNKAEIYWPSGIYQKITVKAGARELSINEQSTGPAPKKVKVKTHFVSADAPDFTHKEKIFDDFKRQPLLPSKLSQLGPCLAKGDVDGDGDEDFFVGGATEQAGAIYLNQGGAFTHSPQPALEGLAKYAEDSAALWFDADGDKDLDLFVVTGSTEYEPSDILYYDHLYLNETVDGVVTLTEAPDGSIPDLPDSGSCVTAADYDQDGDLDLFIGSRSIPGQYPALAKNRLLRNDSANGSVKFTLATPPALESCGLVTDAQWADIDRDMDSDLCLTIDWGTTTIFLNQAGELTNVSKQVGTSDKLSWWNCIEAVDVDSDGDLDLLVGNTGINTKYKSPSNKKPAIIYYGDMDGSGIPRIIEAKQQKDKDRPLPVRGRS